MGDLPAELQRLSGTLLDAPGACNVWAGTTQLDLPACLNRKAGTTGLDLPAALNRLAGTTGLDENAAASAISEDEEESVTITDTFSDADGTNLHGKATTTGGETWAVGAGTYDVNTGKARPTALAGTAWATIDSFADFDMSVTITTGAAGTDGVIFRLVDATNYLRLDINNTGDALHLRQNLAGVETQITQTAVAGLAVGNIAVYRVLCVGTSVKIYRDAVIKIDTTSVLHLTATKHGIIAASTNTRFDDFSLAAA